MPMKYYLYVHVDLTWKSILWFLDWGFLLFLAIHKLDLENFFLEKEGTYNGQQAYKNSKVAMVMSMYSLDRMLEGTGVSVTCMNPGNFYKAFHTWGCCCEGLYFRLYWSPEDEELRIEILYKYSHSIRSIHRHINL